MSTFWPASVPAAGVSRRDAMVAAGKCPGPCGGGEPAADGLQASLVVQQPVDNGLFPGKLEHAGIEEGFEQVTPEAHVALPTHGNTPPCGDGSIIRPPGREGERITTGSSRRLFQEQLVIGGFRSDSVTTTIPRIDSACVVRTVPHT